MILDTIHGHYNSFFDSEKIDFITFLLLNLVYFMIILIIYLALPFLYKVHDFYQSNLILL